MNTCRSFSAVGRFFGFFVRAVLTKLWNVVVQRSRSRNVGGLNPDFDIKNNALIGCRSNIGGWSSASSVQRQSLAFSGEKSSENSTLTYRCDAASPNIAELIITSFAFNRSHLRCHPIRRSDERLPFVDCGRDLCRNTEISQLHVSVFRQEYISSFDIPEKHIRLKRNKSYFVIIASENAYLCILPMLWR